MIIVTWWLSKQRSACFEQVIIESCIISGTGNVCNITCKITWQILAKCIYARQNQTDNLKSRCIQCISIHDWKILQFLYAITRVTEGQSHWKGSVGISKTRSSERNWCMQIAYHHQGSLTYQHYTVWAAIIATNRRFSWISKIRSHQSNNLTYTNPLLAYTTSFPGYSLDHKMKLQHSIGHR